MKDHRDEEINRERMAMSRHDGSWWALITLAPSHTIVHCLSLTQMSARLSLIKNHRNRLGSHTERRGRQLFMYQVLAFSHLIEDSPWRLQFKKYISIYKNRLCSSLVNLQLWLELSLMSSQEAVTYLTSTDDKVYLWSKCVLLSSLSEWAVLINTSNINIKRY